MRKWEDIVKDKMEEPEGALPESVFAEFCARWEAAMAVPSKRRFPLVWAVVPAVAAGLAAVLLLHKPSVPEGDIQIIQQPLTTVAVVADTTTVNEPEQTTPLIAQVVTPKVARQAVVKPQEVEIVENVEPAEEDTATTIDDKATQADVPQTDMPDTIDKETPDRPITTTTSPFIPERTKATPVKMKVGPAAGMIAGGGLLAAIIPLIPGAATEMDNAPMADSDKPNNADNKYPMSRQEAIEVILDNMPADTIYSATTGRTSRELFFLREKRCEVREHDFLNVGSMGHASSVALGIALCTEKPVVVLDGDSAAIMHMGALTMASKVSAPNFLHIVLNNGAHESVGGQPSAGHLLDWTIIAEACGYATFGKAIESKEELIEAVNTLRTAGKAAFIDCRIHKGLATKLPPIIFDHREAIDHLIAYLNK